MTRIEQADTISESAGFTLPLLPLSARLRERSALPPRTFTLIDLNRRLRIVYGDKKIVFGATKRKGACSTYISTKGDVQIEQPGRNKVFDRRPKAPRQDGKATRGQTLTRQFPSVEIDQVLEITYTGSAGHMLCFEARSLSPIQTEPVEFMDDFSDAL